jgi:hypothetical protein
MRSFTHSPGAVIHSPAAIVAACPTTVTRSRCPRAFARKTQNPFSALWKVTRSTSPANTSWVDDCGCELIGTIVSATVARTYGCDADMASIHRHSGWIFRVPFERSQTYKKIATPASRLEPGLATDFSTASTPSGHSAIWAIGLQSASRSAVVKGGPLKRIVARSRRKRCTSGRCSRWGYW